MKTILIVSLSLLHVAVFAQKEIFDLTTYTPPKGWKKQSGESAILFSKEDAAKGTYCMITLYKAVPGTANAKENFDLAWSSVVKEMVTVSSAPEMQPAATENGWETQSGYAPFESDGNKGVAMLITASSFDKMVNMIILTNTNVYEKEMTFFLESVSLKKIEVNKQQTQTPVTNNNNTAIIGTWLANASDQSSWRVNNGVMSTISRQYAFNANGTYSFITKTFDPLMDRMFLGRESGTYQISGTNITISPQKSVLQAWSKKNGDQWDKLLNSQNIALEKVTYQFAKHYFEGNQKWNLVLQAGKVTKRDGPFSSNTTFSNAWYYGPVSETNVAIKLPD